ncbi:tectonic-3 isoform X2 [Phyllobates terribilis]|uniref:tectonic-3 isoform X2 n=1 Tax=Phyllobates terribilis TaxID=111132 RepID=UPI003CCAE9DD
MHRADNGSSRGRDFRRIEVTSLEAVSVATGRLGLVMAREMAGTVALLLLMAAHCCRGTETGVTICTCDLSPGSCDIDCCCDPDCTSGDPTNVFSFCLPGSTKAERWTCLYNWLIFRNNTPYPSTLLGAAPAQLFCVSSADASVNYFVTPRRVDAENFASVSDPFRGASFSPASASTPAFSTFYRAGDPVLTVSTSGVLGALRQPAALGGQSLCADGNPAKFLQGDTTSCVRALSNVAAACETDLSLSPSFYYQDTAVLRVPADATDQNAIRVPITSDVTETPVLRGDVCSNVVTQVIYTVLYNGTQGITGVSAAFTLSNMSAGSARLSQTFSMVYKPAASASQGPAWSRSGNPGYLVGRPVLSDIGRVSFNSPAASLHVAVSDGRFLQPQRYTVRGELSERLCHPRRRRGDVQRAPCPGISAAARGTSTGEPGHARQRHRRTGRGPDAHHLPELQPPG